MASVAHPWTNGQVEVTNRTLLHGLCKLLAALGGSWVDVLNNVLWAYRITPRAATEETPFSLVYGLEAVVPAEVAVNTHRVAAFNEVGNDQARREDLDLLEEEGWKP